MERCELYDVEVLDGYFSGIAYIFENEKRFIVEISYDIEFKKLVLKNCCNPLYNSYLEKYELETLEDIKNRNYNLLENEVLNFIRTNGSLVFTKDQYSSNRW
ncbi:hypothetical protein SAMN02910358_00291 [Lachnospiraceae bacterium XBB1006]|nr:hypothetical protein SAMN02910358_00291 [Lachnospiraceae bacterium XBB1006]